jgi:hypothetical protein
MEKTMKTLALISSAFVLSVGLVLLVALEVIGVWTALAAGVTAAIVLALAFVALQDPPKKTEGMPPRRTEKYAT